jgi:membrane-associated phospholipid phosphatase/tRNA A-37 threonylcarbamoyl transferase component Bud32
MTANTRAGMAGDPALVPGGSFVPPTARRSRRRRRPSGARPPLPRQLGRTGKGWLVAMFVLVAWMVVALVSSWARRVTDQVDAALLRPLARMRTDWLTELFRAIDRIATGWSMFVVAAALIVAMVVFRRWRHLFTFLASVVVLEVVGVLLIDAYSRPRPYDVTTVGRWQGYSLPSATAAMISITAVGVIYALVVPGRPRTIAKAVGIAVVAVFVFARLYLGVDHPFDVLVGAAIGVAIPLNAFRYFTPNEVFPVTYRRGKTAHLDVEGPRAAAIRRAVEDQLGVTVLESKPVGLAGSGGSTPLRLRVAGDPDTYLFGKLYAMNHVRADRWYKTGRTILYGRLEDEAPFQSVRRLVQYEDYMMRLLRDSGIPTARPMGVVELTPEREYLLVAEFFDGAEELGDAVVDDQVIDEGLALVRRLWQAGLAHRDIKPANLLVRDGHLQVIDVAFAQVRPSPWRQAVDLANMMLVLAVRTDAERVYERALAFFTPDEIAEAFAATRGIASPTQLRNAMKRDGRDLVNQFRALAPERRPISLQRWGPRRVLMTLGLLAVTALALVAVYGMFVPVELPVSGEPTCGTGDEMILMAQAVPSATAVPCIDSFPAGWTLDSTDVRRHRGHFRLRASEHRVDVTLRRPQDCSVAGAVEIPSDELDMRRYELPEQLPPELVNTRTYLYPGGCVTYRFEFGSHATGSLMLELDEALAFQPRSELVEAVDARSGGLMLCGAGAPTCVGGAP